MEVNHHHGLLDYDNSEGAGPAVEILMNSFEQLIAESESIIDKIMELS